MPPDRPIVIVLGGVNGAGKSTSARALLAEQLSVATFVNADEIARGLNAFAPETVAFAAGAWCCRGWKSWRQRGLALRSRPRLPAGRICHSSRD